MALASGSTLGPYEIIAPLGAGGMGEVYRARDPRIGREVAIKVLPASFSSDPDPHLSAVISNMVDQKQVKENLPVVHVTAPTAT